MNLLRPLAELLIAAVFIIAFYSFTNFFLSDYFVWNMLASFACGFAFSCVRFTNSIRLKIIVLLGAILLLLILEIEKEQVPFLSFKLFNLALGLFYRNIFRTRKPGLIFLPAVAGINFILFPFILTELEISNHNEYVFDKLTGSELVNRDSLPYHFEKGKVYLLNFSFIDCLPCRRKHKYLAEIKDVFKMDKRVEVVLLHSCKTENFERFIRDSEDDFHEVGNLAKKFEIHTMPVDFIIDKTGKLRRKFGSFDPSQSYFYKKETVNLLKRLANE